MIDAIAFGLYRITPSIQSAVSGHSVDMSGRGGRQVDMNKPFQRPTHPKRGRRYIDDVDRVLHIVFGDPLGHWVKLGTIKTYAGDVFHRAVTNRATILADELNEN